MIDAVVNVVTGILVSNACEVNHGVAFLQNGLPVEQPRQIRKRN